LPSSCSSRRRIGVTNQYRAAAKIENEPVKLVAAVAKRIEQIETVVTTIRIENDATGHPTIRIATKNYTIARVIDMPINHRLLLETRLREH
jgi:hypothetical protein